MHACVIRQTYFIPLEDELGVVADMCSTLQFAAWCEAMLVGGVKLEWEVEIQQQQQQQQNKV